MTYKQLTTQLSSLVASHAMIKSVQNNTPTEWLFRTNEPEYPVCCFDVVSMSNSKGGEQLWQVQFFFLDKSGAEHEFETEVISDCHQLAEDVIGLIRGERRDYTIEDGPITITPISDKYEDYLAGTTFTATLTSYRETDGCDVP